MVENIKQSEFNKNVIQVYTQEANFTGYKGFDFTAIDDLEYLIRGELIPYASGIKSSLDQGVNTNQLDLNYITDNVSISGRALTYLSGIANAGVNVNQSDLNYITDNVSISGQALSYLSGIAEQGVSLKGLNTVNVNVTGGSLNVLNEVEIKNALNNPVPVSFGTDPLPISGTVTASNVINGLDSFAVVTGNLVVGAGYDGAVRIVGFNPIDGAPTNLEEGGGVPIYSASNYPLPISGTVTANVFGKDANSSATPQIPVINYDEGIAAAQHAYVVPVQVTNVGGQISEANPLPISGTVTANLAGIATDEGGAMPPHGVQLGYFDAVLDYKLVNPTNPLPIAGTVTANVFGKDANSSATPQIPVILYDEGIAASDHGYVVPVQVTNVGGQISEANPLPISGTVTVGALPTIGVYVVDAIQDGNGNTFGNDRNFPIVGSVDITSLPGVEPVRTSGISNYTINTNVGQAIAQNPNRKELCLQNLSNNILYVKYGSAASSSSFNFILSANSVVDAGDGGILTDQNYNGFVSVSGVSPRFIAWERT